MRTSIQIQLAAMLVLMASAGVAQDEASLGFDDFVGVWNMVYENGRTPSLAISRDDDGTPRILVTSEFGTSGVRDIVVEGNEITFNQESDAPNGEIIRIEYAAKLVDGKLMGTVAVVGFSPGDWSDPFTATKAE